MNATIRSEDFCRDVAQKYKRWMDIDGTAPELVFDICHSIVHAGCRLRQHYISIPITHIYQLSHTIQAPHPIVPQLWPMMDCLLRYVSFVHLSLLKYQILPFLNGDDDKNDAPNFCRRNSHADYFQLRKRILRSKKAAIDIAKSDISCDVLSSHFFFPNIFNHLPWPRGWEYLSIFQFKLLHTTFTAG